MEAQPEHKLIYSYRFPNFTSRPDGYRIKNIPMINAVIVEDEKKSMEVLQALIAQNCEGINIVGTADSVGSGVDLIKAKNPNLIFLDIEMADGSGFDLLERVGSGNYDVIFTTASDEHALK